MVTGDPVRVSICHCLACQRRTGSSYGYQSRFPAQSVTISGQSKQFIRHSDEDAEIPVGAFADPAFPRPQVSVWEERKHGWVVVPDEAEHIH